MIMSLWSLFLVSGNATFPFCIFISGGVGVDEDVAEVDETLADVVVVVVDVVDDEDVVLYVDVFEAAVALIVRDDKGTVGPFLVSTFNDLFKI